MIEAIEIIDKFSFGVLLALGFAWALLALLILTQIIFDIVASISKLAHRP